MRQIRAVVAAVVVAILAPAGALAQESQEGTFVDGEFVEFYEYVPDFMPPDDLKRLLDEGAGDIVVVDTAAPLIFEEEHIPGAVNFPWVHSVSLPVDLPRDRTLVLYCACNDHEDSADMAEKLSQLGYLDVKVLEGGWFTWLDLEYPVAGAAVEEDQ
jgi:rhodanese-related sulfurtransferase